MSTTYDSVVYPNRCLAQTHPDRLAIVANLFGLDPAPPEKCRVLEIGCGDGNNLLPLAASFPDSHFVGFDLAESRIMAGREAVADLGLSNFELIRSDIFDFPLAGEPFDYVIAHGIYSWIPAEVRNRLLAICRARLAPQGVAYVSYNCLPGCHVRQMVREMMRFHIRTLDKPGDRVRQAVSLCQFVANSIEKPDTYRQLFKEQLEQIQRYGAEHLFHDDLAEVNDPFYFHEFMAQAAGHELQYLGEADFTAMQDDFFSPEARRILSMMQDSRLTLEQYLDFVKCRRFRQTLLCHREAIVQYPATSADIERFHISSSAVHSLYEKSAGDRPVERFADPRGGALDVGHPLGIQALKILVEHWPATFSFPELFNASIARQTPGLGEDGRWRGQLKDILLEAYRAGVVDFRRTPVRCATKPTVRPALSGFARWQLKRFQTITTLRGDNLRIEDEAGKQFLRLLDGTRTWGEIEQNLPGEESVAVGSGANPRANLGKRLEELARLALLEA